MSESKGEGARSDDVDDMEETPVKVKTKEAIGLTRFHITIEPIKFCVGFTIALTNGVIIDLLEKNVCYRKYNMTYDEYRHTNLSTDIRADIEASTAEVNMINNFIQGIFPLFLVMFIGPWSDMNGRKPFILWALRGFLVYYALWTLLSFFPYLPVVFFFIPSIPLGMTGGVISIYVCTWSYTCDNFESGKWTMRFTISIAAMVSGNILGNSLAEYIMKLGNNYGFQSVFLVSVLMSSLGLFYATFFLTEIIVPQEKKGKLIDFKNVKSLFRTVIIHPRKGRLAITIVLMVLMSEIPAFAGEESILYLVGKSEFRWTLGRYNLFAALSALLMAYIPVILVWLLMEKAGLNNKILLSMSSFSMLTLHLMKALAVNEDMFWAVALLTKSVNCIGACIDSELVDTVSEEHVGKAFTVTSILDAFSPLMAQPLYTLAYRSLLPDKTLYIFFLSFGLTIITFLSSLSLLVVKRKQTYIQPPDKEPPNEHAMTTQQPSKRESYGEKDDKSEDESESIIPNSSTSKGDNEVITHVELKNTSSEEQH